MYCSVPLSHDDDDTGFRILRVLVLDISKGSDISNIEKNQTTTLLKFLDNRYSYLAKNNEDACCYEMMEKLQIDFLEETKEIANYTCNKAIVTYPSSGISFPIYYTKDINVKNPNQSN